MGWLSNIATLGIPSMIGHIVGAKIAADASKNAAKTQAAAGEKAIGIVQGGQNNALNAIDANYGKAASLYDPYRQVGLNALPSLMNLAGSGYPQGRMAPPVAPQPSVMGMGTPQPNAPQGGIYGAPQQGSGMVRMKAPTGQVAMVPQAQVQAAQAKGAVILQ